jgi:hypothetical protein
VLNVLSSIEGQWDVVKYYNGTTKTWKTFRIGSSVNNLFNIDHTMGFWLHTFMNCSLTVSGQEPASTNIVLYAGWNLVGYPSQTERNVAVALWGTSADRVEVFLPESPYIQEAGPAQIMNSGEGYWIRVPADTVWIVEW